MPKNPYEVTGAAAETRWRQPAADLFGPVPFSCAHVGVSTAGKTSQQLTIINAVLPVMDRVVIFSHSISPHSSTPLDPAWQELREKIADKARARGENPETHPFVFDSLAQLPRVIAQQRERVQEGKDTGATVLPQLLVVLSDMLGEQRNPHVELLATRGRHAGISLSCDSQVVRGLGANARKNFSMWCLGKLPASDWKIFEDENAGVNVDRKQLRELWQRALAEPYGFLFYKPREKPGYQFYSKFSTRLVPS